MIKKNAVTTLMISTIAFSVCFACWIINAVLITYLVSHGIYNFTESEVGWLLAAPILTGALSRVPLGIMTDRVGGRWVFIILMLVISAGMYALSFADSYQQFLYISFIFGLAGGSFAVGVGYVSVWFSRKKQGTALGVFGMGNAGAALTTLFAPTLLNYFTEQGANVEGWRMLPKTYALLLLAMTVGFFLLTENKLSKTAKKTLMQQLAPLKNLIVWRFGFYYFLVFGAFVSLAQWIVPYSVNVYQLSIAEAGLLATLFSLPSGIVRALGGWMSDRVGARSVMYGVFITSIITCLLLSIPKMTIESPGKGILAKNDGIVTHVSPTAIHVDDEQYSVLPAPKQIPAEVDQGKQILPQISQWQEPVVSETEPVEKKQLLAEGISSIYYPANLWIFATLVLIFGIATGIGKAAVFRFIPDQFPDSVGTVGGIVGLLGALGGFFFPPVFGYLLELTGVWSSCWLVLALVSIICLVWMHIHVRKIMQEEAPDLAQLMEHRPKTALPNIVLLKNKQQAENVEDLLKPIPFFAGLNTEEIREVVEIGVMQTVKAQQVLFETGDQGEFLYVIINGEVNIYNEQQTLGVRQAGDIFGEMALIDGQSRSASVKTSTTCQLFLIHRQDFLRLVAKSPHMLADLLQGLSNKIRSLIASAKIDKRLEISTK